MDIKGKAHSNWTEEEELEERKNDKVFYFSEWMNLFGLNKKVILQRFPLFIKSQNRRSKKSAGRHLSIRLSEMDYGWMDRITFGFRINGRPVFESNSEFIRMAIKHLCMFCDEVRDDLDELKKNENIRLMDHLNYLENAKNKVNEAVFTLKGYIKLLKNDEISKETFIEVVNGVRMKLPKFCVTDFDKMIQDCAGSELGSMSKSLFRKLKSVKKE